jgi:hypothetical protein
MLAKKTYCDMAQDIIKNKVSRKTDYTKLVEKTIKESDIYLSEKQLRERLPRRIREIELRKILNKLEKSNKIMYDKDDTIIWTFADNDQIRKTLKESVIFR